MPRYASSQLRWSEQAQTYILFSGDQERLQVLSSDWLEQISSFSFHSRWGMHYTVRKQRVQRGGCYWYAYRRLHGRIVKRYLGRTADLTLARLEEVAHLLENTPASQQDGLLADQDIALFRPAPQVPHVKDAVSSAPVAAAPLLLSKLSPPRLHALLLDRPRLFALLDAGRECSLTLLSAPAGFGKTTFVCQWMTARCAQLDFPPVAWLSLEVADNDPLRFWRYLIAACQTFRADLAQVHSALAAMTPQPPFMPAVLSTVLNTLLNALTLSLSGGILVLEDYHVIAERAIHETLSFFLDHLPVTFRLVVITRSDPPLPLALLRARNDLHEVRTADLRFSHEEAGALLRQSLPFELSAATLQRLDAQLEGWGAGLHLTKLALQRIATPAEEEQALTLFSRDNASLQEYFVTQVLDLQPEPVQQFLLQTGILTRLTASLCDAVTEQQNSQEMLTLLERANLFLEPLTRSVTQPPAASQSWYRYHTLFAEAMRNEARHRFGADQLHQLSMRASHWYEAYGYAGEAIDAALDARDYGRAASLIERSIEEQTLPGEIHEPHTLHRWLVQLPETLLKQHPILCLSYATTLLFLAASWLPNASTLRSLEKLLHSAEESFRAEKHLPKLGELFAFRALLALRQGNTQAALLYAKQALDCFAQASPSGQGVQHIWRGLSLSAVAEEWIEAGQFQQARTALLEAYALCEAAENHYFKRVAMIKVARICFELGEFQRAGSLYRQVLPEAREQEHLYVLCNALFGLAALYYEYNELERACQHAQEAIALGQAHHLLHHEVQATLILARVQQAQGQGVVAQQQLAVLLDKIPVSSPHLSQNIQAAQARLALAAGDHVMMQRWATGRLPQRDFSQEIEEELLISRWLRAQDELEEASRQLERLLAATRKAEHARLMLEIQVEMALVAAAGKRKTEAQHLLREVLAQAAARNAIRLFLDAGEQMALLLRSLHSQLHDQPLLTFIRSLLNAFAGQEQNDALAQAAFLVEPLSRQEMRVLRLLVQRRSNADIANELVVSVNTVRTQVQSIYRKLGVHTRSAAGEVAREQRLIS
jgi:LuxR family maltose regulon positive regulatory protein